MALKEIHGGAAWYDWERELVAREPQTIARWREKLADQILYYEFVQYAFFRQWTALREACARHDIHLIGDMPIFVAQDSADVWARPDLFQLDETGRPLVVAGVPPDYFSETGQLWGNPLYRWEAHAAEKFAWWIARLKASTDRVDLIRLDHFRGFEAYWEVPAGSETAATGRWALGPGTSFLEALREGLGGLPLIAEDLGKITAEVEALRDRFELPGMRSPPVRLRRRGQLRLPPPPQLCPSLRRLYGHPRQRHHRRLVHGHGRRDDPVARAGPGRTGLRPALPGDVGGRDPLGPDPGGIRLGGGHGHHPHAGRPRPRPVGAHERAGACGEGTGAGGSGPTSSNPGPANGWRT